MAKIKGAIVVDTERCKGCNLCVVACPLLVIALTKEVNGKMVYLCPPNIGRYLQRLCVVRPGLPGRMYLCF